MNTGAMRHLMKLEKPTQNRESSGGIKQYYEPVTDIRAEINQLSGRALEAAQAIKSEVTVRLKVRYRADMKDNMRLIYDNQIYQVQYMIDPTMRKSELHVYCSISPL